MAFVAASCLPLDHLITKEKESKKLNFENMIMDVLADNNLLLSEFKLNVEVTEINAEISINFQTMDIIS